MHCMSDMYLAEELGQEYKETLSDMDQAIRNFKLGQVSDPVDLSDF